MDDQKSLEFKTQEGKKYGKKVRCKILIILGESCSEMEMKCSSFNLALGSFLSVRIGDENNKKYDF